MVEALDPRKFMFVSASSSLAVHAGATTSAKSR
jgi:hypothetical protein